jgi:hypothetical protein
MGEDIEHRLTGFRVGEGVEVEPLVAMMHRRYRTFAFGCPDASENRFET